MTNPDTHDPACCSGDPPGCALEGPYDQDNGVCWAGHPVNWAGRCQKLNEGLCYPPEPL